MQTTLEKELKNAGQSHTKPRQVVFETLLSSGPLSMHEVIRLCLASGINRASVYRTIQLFEDLGLVRRVTLGWKYKLELSDVFSQHHHHISCRVCGITNEISASPQLEKILDALLNKTGFSNIRHEVEASGICLECMKKQGALV